MRQRVSAYLKQHKNSRFGGSEIRIKTVVMLSIYLVPLIILGAGFYNSYLVMFSLYLLAGLGMGGVGMGVMHDALHGSYSSRPALNRMLGYTMNLIGGNHVVWKFQHNVLHHTYTNVEDHDDDINAPYFLRLSPHGALRKIHRYQHLYAWFFYGLSTLYGVIARDYKKMYRFYSLNLIKSTSEFRQNLAGIALWKTVYLAGTLILPILMSPFAWWMVVLAFIAMHFVTGVTLTLVFQSAHVMPDNEYPLPDEQGELGSDKWEHQLKTTCNFAMENRTVTWLLGGLNHQIEHHLFPHVSHVHYSEISKIVQATALEYGVPYHAYPTFSSAIKGHFSMLYKLGNTGS